MIITRFKVLDANQIFGVIIILNKVASLNHAKI